MRHTHPKAGVDHASKVKTLTASAIFSQLSKEGMDDFASLLVPVSFSKGSVIFADGDPSDFLYIVHAGRVKLYKGSVSGKTVTVSLGVTGIALNGLALDLDKYFLTAEAVTDTVVLRISKSEFREVWSKYPVLSAAVRRYIAGMLSGEHQRLADAIGADVEHRIVHCLALLSKIFGSKIPMTRAEFAVFAGTTTETTIRTLVRLREQGLIGGTSSSRGEITITDLDKLKEYDFIRF
ncbi:MAG: Crp/Fnr family transcriptional regulator [Deltaproteobacteria bacterium]|nr:Crp/Fnr family transcriptional regulator [Deltaproteobacteria bacterium]